MDIAVSVATTLHLLAVVIWVGGMFFAHLILRPATRALPSMRRLPLWGRVLGSFFSWVWIAALGILISGHGLLFVNATSLVPTQRSLLVMMVLGDLMFLFFLYAWFGPYRALKAALALDDWSTARLHQGRIRRIVLINLILGLATIVVATEGRLLGV